MAQHGYWRKLTCGSSIRSWESCVKRNQNGCGYHWRWLHLSRECSSFSYCYIWPNCTLSVQKSAAKPERLAPVTPEVCKELETKCESFKYWSIALLALLSQTLCFLYLIQLSAYFISALKRFCWFFFFFIYFVNVNLFKKYPKCIKYVISCCRTCLA